MYISLGACVKRFFCVFFLFFSLSRGFSQIQIGSGHYRVETYHLNPVIICNQLPAENGPYNSIQFEDRLFNFASTQSALVRGVAYQVTEVSSNKSFSLWFCGAPIVDIMVAGQLSTTEIAGSITVTDTLGNPFVSDIGIRHRGATSLTFPKKSFRVQLRQADASVPQGWSYRDESLLGMRNDKRWLLLALYNERLRINNKVSHELWADMHKLYYLNEEPEAKSTISTRYAAVFLNGRYQGIYLFTENTDRKQLKLKKENKGVVRGELYKGESNSIPNFFGPSTPVPPATNPETWEGWELEYPDATDWANLRALSTFAITSSDADFIAGIGERVKLDNVRDYLIFVNLIRAIDNWGKNLFMAKYKEGEPYFYIVWDLDGTWGYYWDGSRDGEHRNFMDNHLFRRMRELNVNHFNGKMAQRWFSLRNNLLSEQALLERLNDQYYYLKGNGFYSLETLVKNRADAEGNTWSSGLLAGNDGELQYAQNWLRNRLTWLDSFMEPYRETALPVVLQHFDGSSSSEGVELNWATSAESGSDYFEVSSSPDVRNWTVLGRVRASGSQNGVSRYSFLDQKPRGGVNYYKLRMVDLDGSAEFSRVISVHYSERSLVTIFPNPAKNQVRIVAGSGSEIEKTELINVAGQIVRSSETEGQEDTLDVSDLVGLFLIRVHLNTGEVETTRIVVE